MVAKSLEPPAAATAADREIVTTRTFAAPRELVFELWTKPEHVARWYGPRGFTLTTYEMDVRPGGVWRFMFHGPDGTDYPNKILYTEVRPPERLVYDHGDFDRVWFQGIVTFEEEGGGTKVTLRSIFATAEERDKVAEEYGAVEGAKQTLDRLGEALAAMTAQRTSDDEFIITRVFDAPRELVWKAHTEKEHLAQWWGPKGFTVHPAKLDLRPGGTFHYAMRASSGEEMWGKFVYREIVPPERLVWVNSFSDPEGNTAPVPMAEGWPTEMLITMTFTEEDGRTTLNLRSVPINASDEERRTFREGHDSMRQGFGGSFDQLAAYLAKAEG